jgi:hypothetical protein
MKIAFWSLFVVGFVLCSTLGIGPALQRAGGDWTSPVMIAGSLMGLALLGLAVVFAFGFRPGLLQSELAMVLVLGVLIAAKVGVGVVQAIAR